MKRFLRLSGPRRIVAVCLLGACLPDASTSDPAPVAAPEVVVFDPVQSQTQTRASELRVAPVQATALPGGGWRVVVRLAGTPSRVAEFDGLSDRGRGEVFRRVQQVLVAGSATYEPEPVDESAAEMPEAAAPGIFVVPYDPPRYVLLELSYVLPAGPLPDDLVLQLRGEEGVAWAWLRGGPRTASGVAGVAVQPVDPAGRPAREAGVLTVDGSQVTREERYAPFIAASGQGQLAMEGAVPVSVTLGSAPFLPVVVAPDDPMSQREADFARVWPSWPGVEDGSDDLAALAQRLVDADAATAWVRDHVAVLATTGLRQSTGSLLRSRAGNPQERAMLLRALLTVQGRTSRFVCGELDPATATALYASHVTLPAAPEALAATVDRLRDQADDLARGIEALLDETEHAPGARTTYALVPEWCWVQVEEVKDEPWRDLDLRPAPFDQAPLPHAWRSTTRSQGDAWRMQYRVTAVLSVPGGGQEEVIVADYAAVHTDLPDTAFVVDQLPGEARGTVRTVVRVARDTGAGGRMTDAVDVARITSLVLELGWADPDGIATRRRRVELWDAFGGQPYPRALRLVLTAQPPIQTLDDIAAHARRAVVDGHSLPAAEAGRATHALWNWLSLALRDGVPTSEPSVWMTLSTADAAGRVVRSTKVLPPSLPLWFGEVPDDADRARSAAIDAVVRAAVLDASVPAAPEAWLVSASDVGRYRRLPADVQVAVARSIETTPYASSAEGDLWVYDPEAGALAWYDAVPHPRPALTPTRSRIPAGDAAWSLDWWDLTDRCELADLLARLAGGERPAVCAPWSRETSPPDASPDR